MTDAETQQNQAAPDGLTEELRTWQSVFEEHDEVIVVLYRRQPNGKLAYLSAVDPDVGEAEISRVYGGGTYRLQARAGVNARGLKRGNIIQQRSIYIEGPPKTTKYAGLHEALEAEARGADAPQPGPAYAAPYAMPAPSQPSQPMPSPTMLDPNVMMAQAFSAMGTMMAQQAARADQRDAQNMQLLMAMLSRDVEQRDPIESMDRMFSLASKIAGKSDDGAGAAWIEAIPVLEPLIDRMARALETRRAASTTQTAAGRSPRPVPPSLPAGRLDAPEPEPEQSSPEPPQTEHRMGLALRVLDVAARDPDADPHALASTLASLLGDDAAQALADEPTAVDQLIVAYPDLLPRRVFLESVQSALGLMYEPDPAEDNGSVVESEAVQSGASAER